MKYTGFMYYQGYVEEDGIITDAILLPRRLAIDWTEAGDVGHLKAETMDGLWFRGTMSYQPPSGRQHDYELRLYSSGEDRLLFGTWRDPASGEAGRWTFVLTPRK